MIRRVLELKGVEQVVRRQRAGLHLDGEAREVDRALLFQIECEQRLRVADVCPHGKSAVLLCGAGHA
jgi:hypothetical protein